MAQTIAMQLDQKSDNYHRLTSFFPMSSNIGQPYIPDWPILTKEHQWQKPFRDIFKKTVSFQGSKERIRNEKIAGCK
jgi:hypothetical protein